MEPIGKYTIARQIGLGGFGVVYEGADPFLKRRVAIKTCTTDEEEIRDRFFREAEIAGNLKHPNIVTVHDFGVQDGVPYLVQEYLDGEDLTRLIARREPLPAEGKLELLLQVAQGLEYAHSRGVIHRDVKPANIRVTESGAVKIMDFGIAKLANVASHLTRTGMTLGTAAYLPPEQIRGVAVDHRADIFSFGVLAFELLAYSRPFVGRTISVLFFEILHREPPALAELFPGCPPSLEAAIHRCLGKDPATRYPGFGPLILDLEKGLEELRAAPRPEDRTTVHDVVLPEPAATASRLPSSPRPSPDAPSPPATPPPRESIPLVDRATRRVSPEIIQQARELAARDQRRMSPAGDPATGTPGGTPLVAKPTWGPEPVEAPPAPAPSPTAPGAVGRSPRPERRPPQPAVPYPTPPARPRSFWGDLPWPLLGALGAAILILVLAVLLAVYFAF